MAEPKLRGTLSIDSIPFKILGNTITRGNVTVLTPEDFPRQHPQDHSLLMHILFLNRTIRSPSPIVIEFARAQELLRPIVLTRPEDTWAVGEANSKDLRRVVEQLYGPIEFKTRAEILQDSWS